MATAEPIEAGREPLKIDIDPAARPREDAVEPQAPGAVRSTAGDSLIARFLEERNIKWLLGTGVLLLVGSSLVLLGSHWQEITPLWKSLTLFGYTGLAFAAGWLSLVTVGLPRTGTWLLALTTALLPVNFLCLELARGGALGSGLVLLATLALFGWHAASRSFEHLFRGRQNALAASFIGLGASAPLLSLLPAAFLPAAALGLWAIFALGVMRSTHRIFWLAEEHRRPRISGMAPLVLLGGQFLAIYLLLIAPRVALPWVGLGLALVAAPVLFTADAAARALRARGNELPVPLPSHVVAPFGLGLLLCAASLAFSTIDLFSPVRDARAVVPTSALVAVLLGLTALRTGKRTFVWLALLCSLMAYQLSPSFFRETAASFAGWSARQIGEKRLPLGYYGLTYAPLLLSLLGARWWGAKRLSPKTASLFLQPSTRFAHLLGVALLVLGASHAKAAAPVGACLAFIFGIDAAGSRRPFATALHLGGLLLALGGAPLLGRQPGAFPGASGLELCGVAATGLIALALAGRLHEKTCLLAAVGLGAAGASAWAVWLELGIPAGGAAGSAALLAALLLASGLRVRARGLGELAATFWLGAPVLATRVYFPAFNGHLATTLAAAAFAMWGAGALLGRGGGPGRSGGLANRLAAAYARPSRRVGGIVLLILATAGSLPFAAGQVLGITPWALARSATWGSSAVAVAWCLLAAHVRANILLGTVGCVAALPLALAAELTLLPHAAPATKLLLGALTGFLFFGPAALALRRSTASNDTPERESERVDALLWPALFAALGAFLFSGLFALGFLGTAARLAGCVSLLGLAAASRLLQDPGLLRPAPGLASGHLLFLAAGLAAPLARTPGDLFDPAHANSLPAVAAVAAALVLTFDLLSRRLERLLGRGLWLHQLLLRTAAGAALLGSLVAPVPLPLARGVLAGTAFALLSAGEAVAACVHLSIRRAWCALALPAAGIAYFVHFGWIDLGGGWSSLALLGTALLAHGLGEVLTRYPETKILGSPLRVVALALPAAALALSASKQVLGLPVPRVGVDRLALLGVCTFYFWRAVAERRKDLAVAAAASFNVALAITWSQLAWTDLQLYLMPAGLTLIALVEVLGDRVPAGLRNPLRYAGALVVLASPIPDILAGAWLPMVTLLVAATLLVVAALVLRLRALLHAGTAFLVADLAAMVLRAGAADRNVLWASGVLLGAALIALAACCELRRESVAQRVRMLTEALKTWS